MSFDTEDIAGEWLGAVSRGREWFDGEGYSFRRLGRLDNGDVDKLANLLRYQRWAKAHRERQRAISRAAYRRNPEKTRRLARAKRQRMKANPRQHAKRLASWAAYRARVKADAEKYRRKLEADRARNQARRAKQKRGEP